MKNKLTILEQKELCENYRNNINTINELSKKYNLTNVTICNYLKRNNIPIRIGKISEKEIQKIIELYKNKTITFISKQLNLNPSTIWRILKKNNVEIKNKSKIRQKFNINENFFKKIDSESKAYFLGLLYADGCLSPSPYQIKISLQERDKYILEIFKKELMFNGQLKKIDRYKKINSMNQVQYSLVISNKNIYKNLNALGLFPNKSLKLKFPSNKQVPTKLINHFILGYFDGDGCIIKNPNNQKYISFLGTYEFLYSLKDILVKKNIICEGKNKISKIKNSNIFTLKVGGNRKIIKIYNFLYNNSHIFLSRKKEKFQN